MRETLLVRGEREKIKENKDSIIELLNCTNNDTNYDYLYTTLIGLGPIQLALYLNIKSNQI